MIENISIILPARNEAINLKSIIPALLQKYDKNILEIIVINDCSSDDTNTVVDYLQKKHSKLHIYHRHQKPGVGLAVKYGIDKISQQAKYVLFMDSDFLINISDIAKFLGNFDGLDGIVGSRFMNKESLEHYPLYKYIANRAYQWLAKIFLGVKHSDLTNNFKLYKKSLVMKIYPHLTASDFAFNAQLGFYPVLMGAKIGQVPVRWRERTKQMGISKFKILKVGPSYAKVLLQLLSFRIKKS